MAPARVLSAWEVLAPDAVVVETVVEVEDDGGIDEDEDGDGMDVEDGAQLGKRMAPPRSSRAEMQIDAVPSKQAVRPVAHTKQLAGVQQNTDRNQQPATAAAQPAAKIPAANGTANGPSVAAAQPKAAAQPAEAVLPPSAGAFGTKAPTAGTVVAPPLTQEDDDIDSDGPLPEIDSGSSSSDDE